MLSTTALDDAPLGGDLKAPPLPARCLLNPQPEKHHHSQPMRFLAPLFIALISSVLAQAPPYENSLAADPPYYRIRYEASANPGELTYPVSYTVWIPQGAENAARTHRSPARLRRRIMQIRADRRVRSALAGAGEEARLRPDGTLL